MAKKEMKPFWDYFLSGIIMIFYSLIFSLFSLVFLLDSIPKAVKIIFGILFMVPVFFLLFNYGKSKAEKMFTAKRRNLDMQAVKNRSASPVVNVPPYVPFFHTVSYFAIMMLIVLLGCILGTTIGNSIVHGIAMVIYMPVCLIFQTTGIIMNGPASSPVTWMSAAVFIPVIIINCAIFVLAYFLKIKSLNSQQRGIHAELRMFDN